MALGDLVRLQAVKDWLNIKDTSSDVVLTVWITGASRAVLNMLQRGSTMGFHTLTEIRDGTGGIALMLNEWPVLTVLSLSVGGSVQNIQTDKPYGSGFFWEQWGGSDSQGRQQLWCGGVRFYRNPQSITVTYNAGYQITGETYTIPAPSGGLPAVQTARPWFSDQGVITAAGVVFTVVTGTPAQGQYSVDENGIYTFSLADAGTIIGITYSYTPEDLRQGVIDLVGWHFRNRDRIGMVSRSMGGQETTMFSQKCLGETSLSMLQPYKSVAII